MTDHSHKPPDFSRALAFGVLLWAMSTTEITLTAHLVMPAGTAGDHFLREVCDRLHQDFGIEHSTIQIERNAETCALA